MIAADCQHWNLQLALGEQLLIVDGILRKGCDLSTECVVDGAWSSIERGIMIARLFIDAGRICRKFVVEAVQQDALTSGHQPFRIRSAEVEVPSLWVLQLFVPMADPWEGCIHDYPLRHTWLIQSCKGVAHHVADVGGGEVDCLYSQLGHACGKIPSL